MITELIEFKNLNDEDDSRVVHFHISEAVMLDNLIMTEKLERLGDLLGGPTRQLVPAETQEMVDMVKWFMSISYGIKSADGMDFDQDDPAGSGEIWRKFKNSPVYSVFLMSLFKDTEKMTRFIMAVLPESLLRDNEAIKNNPELHAALKAARKDVDKPERYPPGTKIIDGVPQLQSVPDAPVAPTVEKKAVTQQHVDLMKSSLNDKQFEEYMSDKVITEPTPTT